MRTLALCVLIALQGADTPTELRSAIVSVVDAEGQPVRGLMVEDVALLENGAARTLHSFAPDDRPLRLAILVDSSQPVSSAYRLQVVPAVARFLEQLPGGTLYTLWVVGDRPQKLIERSDERARATVALQKVFPRGGNTLLDGLVDASKDLEVEEEARGAIVVVTGDGAGFTNYDRRSVVDRVAATDISVYAVQFHGAAATVAAGESTMSFDYDYVLDNLARETGGRREHVLAPMAVEKGLDRILAELTGRYRLTYETTPDLEKRELSLEVALEGAEVRVVQPERE